MGLKYNMNYRTLYNIMKKMDIERRNLSESQINYVKKNGIKNTDMYPYKSEYYESKSNKISHFYRSSYELEYYKKLDEENIVFETEKFRIEYFDSIKNINRIAIPDIYIPIENKIIEIKSKWTYNKQNMDDKIKSYIKNGYNVLLLISPNKSIFNPNCQIFEYKINAAIA
jgi:hypothetical protein